jgi:hypothetical protein
VVALGLLISVFATLCILPLLLAIPFVGTLVVLPLLALFRLYSIEFLAELGPEWTIPAPVAEPAP